MDRRIALGLVALLVIALARYIAVAFYVHPFADDFSYAVAGMHNELFLRLADEYRFWNGRWLSNILVLRGPLVLGMEKGLWLYRCVPVAMLVITWCGAFALMRSLVSVSAFPRWSIVVGASLFLQIYLQLMPDVSEGIYWYTGSVSYQFSGALMLFLAAAWVKLLDAKKERRASWLATVVVLAVVICGCNELHMVYMVLLHTALLFVPQSARFRVRPSVLVVLGFVLVAAMVMVLAPGNAGRAAQFPHKHEIDRTLLWGSLQTGRFLLVWIASPTLLIASLLYLMIGRWIMERSTLLQLLAGIHPWRWALFTVAMVFLSMALPYWNTGLLGQHRTVNATLLLFLPCWFIFLTIVRERWLRSASWLALIPLRRAPVACALLALAVLATGSGGQISKDILTGRLARFDAELTERYARIERAAANGSSLEQFPALENRPASLRFNDATPDPEHWINRSITQYFGSGDLRIAVGAAASPATAPQEPR